MKYCSSEQVEARSSTVGLEVYHVDSGRMFGQS